MGNYFCDLSAIASGNVFRYRASWGTSKWVVQPSPLKCAKGSVPPCSTGAQRCTPKDDRWKWQ